MSSLRERYAKAGEGSLQRQKEMDAKLESLVPKNSNNRPGYITIEEGKNYIRIYPAHVGSDCVWGMKAVHWIPGVVEDKTTGVQKEGRVPVFNARVHGGFDKDPVEHYVYIAELIVRQKFNGYQMNAEEKQAHGTLDRMINNLLWPIKNFKDGLGMQSSWVAYADKYADLPRNGKKVDKVFGRLEVFPKVRDEFNKQAAAIEDCDSPAAIDPFSDLDGGWLVNLQKTVQQTVDKSGKSKKETTYTVAHVIVVPLSEEDLEAYDKVDPLDKLFVNSYKRSDFEKAIEGLKIVEKKYKYGVLKSPEFIQYVDEMNSLFPQDGEQVEGNSTDDANDGDEFDAMNREELIEFCKDNKVSILITRNTPEEELREAARQHVQPIGGDLPWDKDDEPQSPQAQQRDLSKFKPQAKR